MVRPECQDIDNQLQDVKAALVVAQQDFLSAERNSEAKQNAKKEVVRLLDRLRELERNLRECEGLPPFPQPVRALFTCMVFAATSTSIFVPTGASNVQAGMIFSDIDFRLVEFTFPDTPVGTSVAGVPPLTLTNVISAKTASTATGSFERSTGHIDLNARFEVHQSLDFADNGTVDFMPLTTRTVPSPMAPGGVLVGMPLARSGTPGRVVLVGSSVFAGGVFFNGTTVDLIIDGVLSAFPPA
jgi:hypothetical protein